jgi:hypothetical protein
LKLSEVAAMAPGWTCTPWQRFLVDIARETLGTIYGHQQRLNGVQLDCAGVPAYLANKIGLDFDDPANYGRIPIPHQMRAEVDKRLVRVTREQMEPGDVVWIRFKVDPTHFAIVADYKYGGLSLIHATNSCHINKVVEHRLDQTWLDRIVAVWRFPGVEA